MHELISDTTLERRRDQAGCQIGADDAQDQHQQEERKDDLGPDSQGRHRQPLSQDSSSSGQRPYTPG